MKTKIARTEKFDKSKHIYADFIAEWTKALAPVQSILTAVNGGAEAHTYNHAAEIVEIVERAEAILFDNFSLSKKDAQGALIIATSGKAVAKRYKYPRRATRVVIRRGASDWFLSECDRTEIYTGGGGFRIVLPADKRDGIFDRCCERNHISFQ
jgi:hypothetical protein